MAKSARTRIFSVKRLFLSIVLGFLLPLSYAFLLSEVSDRTGKTAPEFLVTLFMWPRPLWIFLIQQQPSDENLVVGIVFLAICNIALYGTIIYTVLLALSLVRRKQAIPEPPPTPEPFHPDPLS